MKKELTREQMDFIVSILENQSDDDVKRINLRVQAEMIKRGLASKPEKKAEKPASKTSKKPVKKAEKSGNINKGADTNDIPVLNQLKYEDRCGKLIRNKNYVMSIPGEIISRKQRYCVVKAAEELGGVKLKPGDRVYDAYHEMDPYILVIIFGTTEKAVKFMDGQHNYRKAGE